MPGPIAINTARPEDLLPLPGVGEKLAGEIVRHRKEHGLFTGPGDLARVRGIGARRADALAPWLDFSRPRNWPSVLTGVALVPVAALALAHPMAARLVEVLSDPETGALQAATAITWGAMTVMGLFAMAFPAAVAARDVSRDHARASRFARWADVSVVLLLAALVTGVVGLFVEMSLLGPGTLRHFVSRPQTWTMVATSAYLLLFMLPPLLAGRRPAWARTHLAARAYDAALVLGAPVVAAAVTFSRDWMPAWAMVPYALLALEMLRRGVRILRTRRSEFDPGVYLFAPPSASGPTPAEAVAWLTSVQPDPAFHRALARGLADLYGGRVARYLRGSIVVSAALWILSVAVESVLEMGFQESLKALLCSAGIWCG